MNLKFSQRISKDVALLIYELRHVMELFFSGPVWWIYLFRHKLNKLQQGQFTFFRFKKPRMESFRTKWIMDLKMIKVK